MNKILLLLACANVCVAADHVNMQLAPQVPAMFVIATHMLHNPRYVDKRTTKKHAKLPKQRQQKNQKGPNYRFNYHQPRR